jgi:hypothetical protein
MHYVINGIQGDTMNISQIQKRIDQIDKLELENKTSQDFLKGELENDESYVDTDMKSKEAAKNKKRVKDEILNREANKEMSAKIKDNAEEILTLKEILSLELMQLYQSSKTDFVEDSTGEQRKFKLVAKLLPKKNQKFERNNPVNEYIEIPA